MPHHSIRWRLIWCWPWLPFLDFSLSLDSLLQPQIIWKALPHWVLPGTLLPYFIMVVNYNDWQTTGRILPDLSNGWPYILKPCLPIVDSSMKRNILGPVKTPWNFVSHFSVNCEFWPNLFSMTIATHQLCKLNSELPSMWVCVSTGLLCVSSHAAFCSYCFIWTIFCFSISPVSGLHTSICHIFAQPLSTSMLLTNAVYS